MNNKCPKCGYEFGEFDIFCARCGEKLSINNEFKEQNEEIQKKALFLNLKNTMKTSKKKFEFFNSNGKNLYDSLIVNVVICLVVVSFILSVSLYFVNHSHSKRKVELQYQNLVNNPQQIPELKEPKTYSDLAENLSKVEKFLSLYLKYSQDDSEKKEKIFASYLNEMQKISHITSENVVGERLDKCIDINNYSSKVACSKQINKLYKDIGVKSYLKSDIIYLYPDYKIIDKKYSKFFNSDIQKYLALKSKYFEPVSLGLNLIIKPKKLVDKICEVEKLHISSSDEFIKEETEKLLHDDFKKLIFSPAIYTTTTQEMTKEFKNAFEYFVNSKTKSNLNPLMLSYMDKKRAYNIDNFKKDYPYKIYEKSFEDNVEDAVLSDIFSQLRKNIFSKNSKYVFAYIYNLQKNSWVEYRPNSQIEQNQYVMSEPDENNSIAIYSNTFSLLQDLNLPKYSRLYLINGMLVLYNYDKLTISKIAFNGRNFSIKEYSSTDITSLFPGIEVINIDSYSNYNIRLTKDNAKATYIVLSRYSNGYSQYILSPIKGNITTYELPNMFSVSDNSEVIVSFHYKNLNPEITSDNAPTYRFVIRTKATLDDNAYSDDNFALYDEKTEKEEKDLIYKPNIMPKIIKESEEKEIKVINEDDISAPPEKNIQPPKENDDLE